MEADHPNTFHLIIASVGETKFDGAALSATFPGESGEFVVLPHHEPLIATLKGGAISVRVPDSQEREFSIKNGVVECSNNRAVVLL